MRKENGKPVNVSCSVSVVMTSGHVRRKKRLPVCSGRNAMQPTLQSADLGVLALQSQRGAMVLSGEANTKCMSRVPSLPCLESAVVTGDAPRQGVDFHVGVIWKKLSFAGESTKNLSFEIC